MNQLQIDDLEFQILIDQESIEKRIRLMGIQLNVDFEKSIPVFIGILNGSFMFMSDLIKQIHIPCEIAFIKLSSYNGELKSGGVIKEDIELQLDITGRDVIIVEDIVDTGKSLEYITEKLKAKKPASLSVCTLLHKPDALVADIDELSYIGFIISNNFVVGYGLDYKGLGRNLPAVYALKS
jgi:hypoxanthine phosphoribosyltransferase